MKLSKVWRVIDPGPESDLEDICSEQDVSGLARYVLGSPARAWESERTTLYTDKDEAMTDAKARLAQRGRAK